MPNREGFIGASSPLSHEGLRACCDLLGVGAAEVWTLVSVETHSCGFLPDRRPVILFERHIFHERTAGAFDASHPGISSPVPGGYEGNSKEYDRLQEAMDLNREAALQSASWGIGQVMGFNFKPAGFVSVETMVRAMQDAEDSQLTAVAKTIRARQIHHAFAAHDWVRFARGYNGGDFNKNHYDVRLAAAFAAFSIGGLPDIQVRQVQVLMRFLGFPVGAIDGILGKRTRSAIAQFRLTHSLPDSDSVDEGLIAALIEQIKQR